MLSISALLSAVILQSAQSCSKSVFNRLTSALTDVLSKLAIKMNRIYQYHIIAFFDLWETPWACENGLFELNLNPASPQKQASIPAILYSNFIF